MIYTLSDLQAGRVAVVNDGTVEQLNGLLNMVDEKRAYPWKLTGSYKFYWFTGGVLEWNDVVIKDLPTQSMSLFSLREEPQERDSLRWEQEIWDAARLHNYIDETLIGVGNGYRYATLKEYLNSKVARNI